MVTNVTSLTGNGLKDWLIQRVSAIYLAAYLLFLMGYLLSHLSLEYTNWHALFHLRSMQIASVIALFLLLLHAWIGIWTVTTDYIKRTGIRVSVQVLVALFLGSQFLWGFMIVWGQ
ncbi:MAG: succinate dehydrogenase, hydrophobic membrane anchor protein [Legionellaceae bacterium]|nr:succinate dehydrogenase, hydrophobic membrane anchor protein [Legionellaceae bacterium]